MALGKCHGLYGEFHMNILAKGLNEFRSGPWGPRNRPLTAWAPGPCVPWAPLAGDPGPSTDLSENMSWKK